MNWSNFNQYIEAKLILVLKLFKPWSSCLVLTVKLASLVKPRLDIGGGGGIITWLFETVNIDVGSRRRILPLHETVGYLSFRPVIFTNCCVLWIKNFTRNCFYSPLSFFLILSRNKRKYSCFISFVIIAFPGCNAVVFDHFRSSLKFQNHGWKVLAKIWITIFLFISSKMVEEIQVYFRRTFVATTLIKIHSIFNI